jgi:hypothetical protein
MVWPFNSNLPAVLNKSFNTLDYVAEYEGDGVFTRQIEGEASVVDVVKSKLTNLLLFWNPGAGGYHAEQLVEEFPPAQYLIWLYKLGFFMILALAFSTLLLVLRDIRIFGLWAIVFYLWALYSMLFPYPRYTLPVMPIMLVLAGYAVWNRERIIGEANSLKKLLEDWWGRRNADNS